jgi:hypothetical protein
VTAETVTVPEPRTMPAGSFTVMVPNSERPAAGAELAVTEPCTVWVAPAASGKVLGSSTEMLPSDPP